MSSASVIPTSRPIHDASVAPAHPTPSQGDGHTPVSTPETNSTIQDRPLLVPRSALRKCVCPDTYALLETPLTVREAAISLMMMLLQPDEDSTAAKVSFDDMVRAAAASDQCVDLWAWLMGLLVEARTKLLSWALMSDDDLLHACGPAAPLVDLRWDLLEATIDHARKPQSRYLGLGVAEINAVAALAASSIRALRDDLDDWYDLLCWLGETVDPRPHLWVG